MRIWQITEEIIDYFVVLPHLVHVVRKGIEVRNALFDLILICLEIIKFALEEVPEQLSLLKIALLGGFSFDLSLI